MLVVRAPMWTPSVRNGSWLTSTGTRGRPIAPGHRQVGALAQHSGVQQRGDLTVHRGDAEWVTWAMTSRAIGPRSRAAPNTDAAAASAMRSDGATMW